MYQCLAFIFVLSILPARSRADDQAPPAPDGWKYVLPKDRMYQFLFPKDYRSIGYTSRKFTARGIHAEVQINYGTLRDGTFFEVQGATFTGRGVVGFKAEDMYNLMIEGEKQLGFAVGEPKEITLGKSKVREYRMQKGDVRCRSAVLVAKNRVFELRVASSDETKLDTEQANMFLQSFILLKEDADSPSKEEPTKAEEKTKEAMEKLGFKWTLKPEEMIPPDKPVTGLILGKEFKPDSITREASGNLRFRQGPATAPEIEVRIIMFSSPKDKFENRTIEFKPGRKSGRDPTFLLTATDPSTRVLTTSSSFDKYAMKLSFGSKGPDGMVPCTIYLCTSDAAKTLMAGKFSLPAK